MNECLKCGHFTHMIESVCLDCLDDAEKEKISNHNENIVYPLCKKCGGPHGMGVVDNSTGLIEPMDICKECLWFGECRPLPFGTEVLLTTDIIICKHCEKETYSCDCD